MHFLSSFIIHYNIHEITIFVKFKSICVNLLDYSLSKSVTFNKSFFTILKRKFWINFLLLSWGSRVTTIPIYNQLIIIITSCERRKLLCPWLCGILQFLMLEPNNLLSNHFPNTHIVRETSVCFKTVNKNVSTSLNV